MKTLRQVLEGVKEMIATQRQDFIAQEETATQERIAYVAELRANSRSINR